MSHKTIYSGLMALVMMLTAFGADADLVERRRDQFRDEQGYYVFPTPYSLPGLGSGWALLGAVSNVANSYTDFYLYWLSGDIRGGGFALSEIHLVPKTLLLDITGSKFQRLFVNSYGQRGMDGDKDDYSILEFDDNTFYGARLTGTFFRRMLEFYAMGYKGSWHIASLRDNEGEVIQSTENSEDIDFGFGIVGVRVDYTDDYQNPRKGLRLDINAGKGTNREDHDPDQFTMQYSLSGYFPFRKWDTLVLNYYQADAIVQSEGETDRNLLEQIYDFDCTLGTPEEQADCNKFIDTVIAGNRYGTAGGLGGTSRLRAYPQGRYSGAHVRFAGIEYRWNLTEESTPFDIFLAKDIRTSIQLAFFYEIGAVADRGSELYDETRANYGMGARMVTEGGFVIRADVASGEEGPGITVIIGYPWESF